MGFRLRRATATDGAAVAGIAEAVRYRPESADGAQGYLVYLRTAEGYASLFSLPEIAAWIAEDECGRALGFLWCDRRGEGEWHLEQIGIHPEARGLGVAAALHQRMLEELRPARLECEIMHEPLRNERSRGFFLKQGWRWVGEKADGPFVWGQYAREDSPPF
jgi:ribosomal protein S18 acetylase RimI-like enzyme